MPARLHLPRAPRILAVAGPAHGDVLLATPVVAALRRAYADARVDVLVYQGQASVLQGNADIDAVLSASKHPGLKEYFHLLRRLFHKYDLAISTKHTDRAIGYAVIAGKSRIAIVPPGRDAWKRRLTQGHVLYDHYDTHTLVQNRALLAKIGIEGSTDLRLPTAPDAPAVVAGLLPAGLASAPFAVLHLNPGLPHKRWTLSGWAEVAGYLDRQGFGLVLTGDGSAAEQTYLASALEGMPATAVNLAGKLRFADVTELLGRCAVYVGTDTVTSHMAAAAGTPTVVLSGPERPQVWGPWPRGYAADRTPFPGEGSQRAGNVLLLQSSAPCPTCRQGDCLRRSERQRSCMLMQNLGSEEVVDGLAGMLGTAGSCAAP
jgi:heptosyltransferase III